MLLNPTASVGTVSDSYDNALDSARERALQSEAPPLHTALGIVRGHGAGHHEVGRLGEHRPLHETLEYSTQADLETTCTHDQASVHAAPLTSDPTQDASCTARPASATSCPPTRRAHHP